MAYPFASYRCKHNPSHFPTQRTTSMFIGVGIGWGGNRNGLGIGIGWGGGFLSLKNKNKNEMFNFDWKCKTANSFFLQDIDLIFEISRYVRRISRIFRRTFVRNLRCFRFRDSQEYDCLKSDLVFPSMFANILVSPKLQTLVLGVMDMSTRSEHHENEDFFGFGNKQNLPALLAKGIKAACFDTL